MLVHSTCNCSNSTPNITTVSRTRQLPAAVGVCYSVRGQKAWPSALGWELREMLQTPSTRNMDILGWWMQANDRTNDVQDKCPSGSMKR